MRDYLEHERPRHSRELPPGALPDNFFPRIDFTTENDIICWFRPAYYPAITSDVPSADIFVAKQYEAIGAWCRENNLVFADHTKRPAGAAAFLPAYAVQDTDGKTLFSASGCFFKDSLVFWVVLHAADHIPAALPAQVFSLCEYMARFNRKSLLLDVNGSSKVTAVFDIGKKCWLQQAV